MGLLLLWNDQITGATATEPEVRAEIDFVSGVATDVSDDLRAFSFTRGKQRELDRYQAGRGNVVLSNADRKYDPVNAIPPYPLLYTEGSGPHTRTLSTTHFRRGKTSWRVAMATPSDSYFEMYFPAAFIAPDPTLRPDAVRVSPNTEYTLSIYIKRDPTIVDQCESLVTLYVYDSDLNVLPTTTGSLVYLTDQWQQVTLTTTTPDTAAYAEPFMFAQNLDLTQAMIIYFTDWTLSSSDGQQISTFVKPNRRVRIPVNYAGTTHMLIEGFIDSWGQQKHGPNDAVTNVSFTDGFKILNKASLATSAYAQEVLADSPMAWFRLGEPESSTKVYDYLSPVYGTVTGTPSFGATSLVSREADTAVEFTQDTSAQIVVNDATVALSGSAFTIEFVVDAPTPGSNHAMLQYPGTLSGISIILGSDGKVYVTMTDLAAGVLDLSSSNSSVVVGDSAPHHVVVTWNGTGNFPKIYVDGVDVTTAGVGDVFTLRNNVWCFGNTYNTSSSFGGILDEVAWYGSVLSDARIAAHAAARSTPWNNDTPSGRITRVLDAVDWSASRRDLDTGTSTLQSASLAMSALEHAQKVGESEFGKLFIDKHGNVRLVARTDQWNQSSVATFTDDASYQASDPEYTDELIRNDVTVSRSEGVAQNVKDANSINEYLVNSYTLDGLYHDDDDISLYAAQYIVNIYKDPQLRISRLQFNPKGNPSVLFPILLGIELGNWVTVQETPQDVGATFTHTAIVEGIEFQWSPKSWSVSLNLSPADTQAYWMAGVPGYSEAGVTTRVSF